MTDALEHRLKAYLDVAPFEDVLAILLLVALETRERGSRRGYAWLCNSDDEGEEVEEERDCCSNERT